MPCRTDEDVTEQQDSFWLSLEALIRNSSDKNTQIDRALVFKLALKRLLAAITFRKCPTFSCRR